jgi:hypothetical protein
MPIQTTQWVWTGSYISPGSAHGNLFLDNNYKSLSLYEDVSGTALQHNFDMHPLPEPEISGSGCWPEPEISGSGR